jgi:pimeloyl-ACP methyl ester carboxylesterase
VGVADGGATATGLGHLHVERVGTGPGVLLSHGVGDDLHVWDAVVPELATAAEVVRWDLRGHGGSDRPDDPAWYSRATSVADLAALMATFSAPPVLVGHSLGGYLSLAHEILHPGHVRAMVLVAAGPGFRAPEGRAAWNASMDRLVARLGLPAPVAGVAHMHDDLVISRLDEVRVPVALLLGADDHRYEPGMRALQSKLPRADLSLVDGVGHDLHTAAPGAVVTAIRHALAGAGA